MIFYPFRLIVFPSTLIQAHNLVINDGHFNQIRGSHHTYLATDVNAIWNKQIMLTVDMSTVSIICLFQIAIS
jgi:hypothetical protein